MTDRKQALTDLLEKVEAGNRTNFIDGFAASAFPPVSGGGHCTFHDVVKAYNGSLDAAKALHEAVLPNGEGWEVYRTGKYPGMIPGSSLFRYAARVGYGATFNGDDDIPARAWLIAIIKALIAKEDG